MFWAKNKTSFFSEFDNITANTVEVRQMLAPKQKKTQRPFNISRRTPAREKAGCTIDKGRHYRRLNVRTKSPAISARVIFALGQ